MAAGYLWLVGARPRRPQGGDQFDVSVLCREPDFKSDNGAVVFILVRHLFQ